MIDNKLNAIIAPFIVRPARWLVQRGVGANVVTLTGLGFAFCSFLAIMFGEFAFALMFIALNRFMDGLDGAIARLTAPTKAGGFLDILCDFIFYGLVPLGFALYDFDNAAPACILFFAFYINGAAFLAFAWLSENTGTKAFSYLSGLTEGFETILFFSLFCLFPSYFIEFSLIFALLCLISAVSRICAGMRGLE